VREMIADIERRTQQAFSSWFQAQGMLTEFILYSAWLQHQDLYDRLYAHAIVIPCNIDHSEIDRIDQRLAEMACINSHTVAIHRGAWNKMTLDQRRQYQTFLIDRGLTSAWQL